MTGKTRVERRAASLARLTESGRAKMKGANEASAREFAALVERIVPKGAPGENDAARLVDTLEVRPVGGDEGVAVEVTIGGPAAPYPLHLEAGHRAANGEHVPGKPYWNPARRVLRKKLRARAARALNAAVKELRTS